MQEHKYPTAFPLKHAQKDMRLALELAHQHGQELPTAAAANGLYEQVSFKALLCSVVNLRQLCQGWHSINFTKIAQISHKLPVHILYTAICCVKTRQICKMASAKCS